MNMQSIKIIILLFLLAGLSAASYRAGVKMTEASYLAKEKAAMVQIVKSQEEFAKVEIALQEEREKKQQVRTQTVTRIKREIIQLPARDCGLTSDERVRLKSAYCVGFPTAASCMPKSVSDSPRAPSGGREYQPAPVGG